MIKKLYGAVLMLMFAPISAAEVLLLVSNIDQRGADTRGRLVFTTEPDKLFKVSVVCKDMGSVGEPEIEGLNNLKVMSSSRSENMTVINSKVSRQIRFDYDVYVTQEGDFDLGPARVDECESGAVVIKCHQLTPAQEAEKFEEDFRNGTPCQIKLDAARTDFYLGEEIVVTLKIYCWRNGVEPREMTVDCPGFTVKEGELTSAVVDVQGRQVTVYQREYRLTTLTPGVKKIKPATVLYTYHSPRDQMNDPFDRMGFFFGPSQRSQQVQTRSNSLELTINELPDQQKVVDGIGQFSSLILSVDKPVLDKGTPVQLTMKVRGQGNFDHIAVPRLKLPNAVRAFPGSVDHGEKVAGEKRFVYIIQPLKTGQIKIPAQRFDYFDPEAKEYKSIFSQEVTLVVEGEQEPVASVTNTPTASDQSTPPAAPVQQNNAAPDIIEEVESDEWVQPENYWSYLMKVLLFLTGMLIFFGVMFRNQIRQRLYDYWFSRDRALKLALATLYNKKYNQSHQLYGIVMGYFSLRFFASRTQDISLERVDDLLRQSAFDEVAREQFGKFLTMLAGLAFYDAALTVPLERVHEDTKNWLIKIDAHLKNKKI